MDQTPSGKKHLVEWGRKCSCIFDTSAILGGRTPPEQIATMSLGWAAPTLTPAILLRHDLVFGQTFPILGTWVIQMLLKRHQFRSGSGVR